MKKLLMVGVLALMASAGAQSGSDYLKSGPIGAPSVQATTCPSGTRAHLLPACWKGQRVIIIPKASSLEHYGYQNVKKYQSADYSGVPHSLIAGKAATITSVEKDQYGISDIVVLKIDGLPDLYQMSFVGGTINELAFVKDLDEAKAALVGKPLWVNESSIYTVDAAGNKGYQKVTRFSKVFVTDIQLATGVENVGKPVRVVVKTLDGRSGFLDVHWSKTNIRPPYYDSLEDVFFLSNPRTTYNFPERIWSLLEEYKTDLGMTSEMVRLSIGTPDKVNVTSLPGLKKEQWVYGGRYTSASYYYFENGVLVSSQK